MNRASTVLCLFALSLLAQRDRERSLSCEDVRFQVNRLESHCEMREVTIAFSGRLSADGRMNGGVSVKSWNRGDVLVRAQVETAAETVEGARALASQIRIDTSAGEVRAQGPELNRRQSWSVNYEIFVPQRADLSLKTHNGGIAIVDVHGRIEFEALNGGVSLKRLGGDVEGHTVNGGLSVELAGDRWDGQKLDAHTTNGGVTVRMPENYSARLETGTVNGHINVDFPVTVKGEISRRLSIDVGSGGPLVRVVTTNGGVNVKRQM